MRDLRPDDAAGDMRAVPSCSNGDGVISLSEIPLLRAPATARPPRVERVDTPVDTFPASEEIPWEMVAGSEPRSAPWRDAASEMVSTDR